MKAHNNLQVAILGATGYIGRAILDVFQQEAEVSVVGYSRDVNVACAKLTTYNISVGEIEDYGTLIDRKYDVLINATGICSPKRLNEEPGAVFTVTEEMDRCVFEYIDKYPRTRVFNISSGAVYGLTARDFVLPSSLASFDVNALSAKDSYALAKLYSEARHRTRHECAIVDLRVFAFVSRFLDIEDTFLVSEIAACLRAGNIFKTKSEDMIRDYSTAYDLVAVIKFLAEREPINDVFDIKSRQEVSKFELLERLREEFGLLVEFEELVESSPTGTKNIYAPKRTRLEELGYIPKRSSLENVVSEVTAFLSR